MLVPMHKIGFGGNDCVFGDVENCLPSSVRGVVFGFKSCFFQTTTYVKKLTP